MSIGAHLDSRSEGDGPEYEVDRILSEIVQKNRRFYLVKWLNYPYEECTWEPPESFLTPDTLAEWRSQTQKGENPSEDVVDRVLELMGAFQRVKKEAVISDQKRHRHESHGPTHLETQERQLPTMTQHLVSRQCEEPSRIAAKDVRRRRHKTKRLRLSRKKPAPDMTKLNLAAAEQRSDNPISSVPLTPPAPRVDARATDFQESSRQISAELSMEVPSQFDESDGSDKFTASMQPRTSTLTTPAVDSLVSPESETTESANATHQRSAGILGSTTCPEKPSIVRDTMLTAYNGRICRKGDLIVNLRFQTHLIGDVRLVSLPWRTTKTILRLKRPGPLRIHFERVITFETFAALHHSIKGECQGVGAIEPYNDTSLAMEGLANHLRDHELGALWEYLEPKHSFLLVLYPRCSPRWWRWERSVSHTSVSAPPPLHLAVLKRTPELPFTDALAGLAESVRLAPRTKREFTDSDLEKIVQDFLSSRAKQSGTSTDTVKPW